MEATGTHLSETIDSLQSLKARYDQNIKEILADKQVLARILKYTMEEYATYTIEEIISCISDDIEVGGGATGSGLVKSWKSKRNRK
jgi:arginine/lysine/ornithine decarboxylase